jgi:hypothetical protein
LLVKAIGADGSGGIVACSEVMTVALALGLDLMWWRENQPEHEAADVIGGSQRRLCYPRAAGAWPTFSIGLIWFRLRAVLQVRFFGSVDIENVFFESRADRRL